MKNKRLDFEGIIARLKRELDIKYDKELSERLGMDAKYISVIKTRQTFGGNVWIKVFQICREKDIDLNWLIYGKLSPGMTAGDLARSTIEKSVTDKEDRDQALMRLTESVVSYKGLPEADRDDELLTLALTLITKLIGDK